MPPHNRDIDVDAEPVMVPRTEKPLVAPSARRVDRLRDHLAGLLRAAATVDRIPPVRPSPEGFVAEVVQTACTLCRGWCCRNGGDDAFLDEQTLARVLRDVGKGDDAAARRYYLDRVPPLVLESSCIFHGEQGCTLDRWARSDVCNVYYCGGLHAYLTSGDPGQPAMVIAGEGAKVRRSRVLSPKPVGSRS